MNNTKQELNLFINELKNNGEITSFEALRVSVLPTKMKAKKIRYILSCKASNAYFKDDVIGANELHTKSVKCASMLNK